MGYLGLVLLLMLKEQEEGVKVMDKPLKTKRKIQLA